MIDATQPIIIDPDGWYTDGQARLLLDVATATLARARRAGLLRYTRAGRHLLYRGAWLLDWLEADGRQEASRE